MAICQKQKVRCSKCLMKPLQCRGRDKWIYLFVFGSEDTHKMVTKYLASFLERRLVQILFKKIIAYQERSNPPSVFLTYRMADQT